MKKISLLVLALIISVGAIAQKPAKGVEVLYFKAELACCQARACNNLENITKTIIEKNFKSNKVTFKTIKLADQGNKSLVDLYKAKSQTVVLVNARKKKTLDVSDIVRKFARHNDQTTFEEELVAKIKGII
ncbi:MAG: hypothetical protein EOM29_07750 [Bacteroidia bacterium]|nr:hypothetical protein [Bacteroidia bacterium]